MKNHWILGLPSWKANGFPTTVVYKLHSGMVIEVVPEFIIFLWLLVVLDTPTLW